MYGHLQDVYVVVDQEVTRGKPIGTVYDRNSSSHLHWEMQYFFDGSVICNTSGIPGPGYTYPKHPDEWGYTDPTNFIASHRQIGTACPAPNLIEPADGAVLSSRTITFRWNAVSGCEFDGYTFRIKNVPTMDSGGTTIRDTGEGGTQRTETMDGWDNTDLYWGVKAANASAGASWAVQRFRHVPRSGPSDGNAVDVMFIVDLSSSYADDLSNFQAQARGIISALKASNPGIRFGLARFEDYPIPPFGSAGDKAYERLVDLTSDTDL
jgi:hypothetical protein